MHVVLTIAGSDSSGGAGIQADLKTFEAFGVFGTSAITVLTAQNTQGVTAIEPVPLSFLEAQLQAIHEDFDLAAVKIGMLFNAAIIAKVEAFLASLPSHIPVVFDPVCISKAGAKLLEDEALAALPSLLPYATVATPNQYEAFHLFEYQASNIDSFRAVFEAPCPILIKNQTIQRDQNTISVDQLFSKFQISTFTSQYHNTSNLHGTGCSFSSAIAANLALGYDLDIAIQRAKRFIDGALKHAPNLGHGPGPINHKEGGIYVKNT